MVAGKSRIHGLDDVVLASSRNVVRYDGNNPSSVRQFGLIIRAVLEEKGLLDAVVTPDQSFDEWLRASGEYSKKDRESQEAYAKQKEARVAERKAAYTVILQWPGVLTPRIMDLCEQPSSPLSRRPWRASCLLAAAAGSCAVTARAAARRRELRPHPSRRVKCCEAHGASPFHFSSAVVRRHERLPR